MLLTLLLSACGSLSASRPAAERTCRQVAVVLSDGPDPQADPVGYAEAQILPLRHIHTSDRALGQAIGGLAAAYQRFFNDRGGSKAAQAAVVAASKRIGALCPGVAGS